MQQGEGWGKGVEGGWVPAAERFRMAERRGRAAITPSPCHCAASATTASTAPTMEREMGEGEGMYKGEATVELV